MWLGVEVVKVVGGSGLRCGGLGIESEGWGLRRAGCWGGEGLGLKRGALG